MHVLCMAGIDHLNCVAFDNVGIIPLIGVCHVVTSPSAYGRAAAW